MRLHGNACVEAMSVARIWQFAATLVALCSTCARSDHEETRPDYGVYHNLSAVYSEIASLARTHPTYVRIEPGFRTSTNLSRLAVRVADFSNATGPPGQPRGSPKVRALLLFGVHGGELVTVESALHFLRKLLGTPGQFGQMVLSKVDLHLVLLANPDARERVERTGDFCSDATRGANLEAPLFGSDRSDQREKTEDAQTLHVLANLSRAHAFDAVVAFRSGAREIRLPFASPHAWLPARRQRTKEKAATTLAKAVARAVRPRFPYRHASRPPLLRLINGKPFDIVRKVPFSLAIGLWDGGHGNASHCFRQLNPGSASLAKTLEELDPLYEVLFLHLVRWKEGQSGLAAKWKKVPLWIKLAALKIGIIVLVAALCGWRRRASGYTQH
ncbi:hypothetical protein V5799_021378 [Amblyomma americanum]|uniref:Peptidase M14 domain-containing protein n=1 Tax=Amblyomma americanum TaxID=6943 RepID=A0AAQ4FPZ6_AMBAM